MPHVAEPDLREVRHIHCIAIAGVGMATLAAMLKARGYRVTGSDREIYPPMSDFLAQADIPVIQGYQGENLSPAPDLVVVGNAVSRTNLEVAALLNTNIPYISFPQAVGTFFLADKRPLVVAGTHGKTTSTALLAWVLSQAGRSPGLLVGGISRNFGQGYCLGSGRDFVIEGDEYDSAFFDKGPKFLHYRPQAVLLNSIEFDHADIYQDLDQIKAAFRRLLELLPSGAPIVACNDFPEVLHVARSVGKPFVTFGLNEQADWQAHDVQDDGRQLVFTITHGQHAWGHFTCPLMGRMNVRNALGVSALASMIGLSAQEVAPGMASFLGVERRQELVGEVKEITIIDDFAHHPTAVTVAIEAVQLRYPGCRVWAVFEPRSNTCRRKIFQKPLTEALARADRILLGPVATKPQDPLAAAELFVPAELAADLQARGKYAHAGHSVQDLCTHLTAECRAGDVVLVMSNGAFGGLPRKLFATLQDG